MIIEEVRRWRSPPTSVSRTGRAPQLIRPGGWGRGVGGAERFGTLKEGIHPRDPLETYCSHLVVSHHAGLFLGSEHQ